MDKRLGGQRNRMLLEGILIVCFEGTSNHFRPLLLGAQLLWKKFIYFCGCLQFFTFFLDNSKKILVSFCIYLWLLICLQVIILYHAIYKLEIMMKGKHVQHLHSNNDADHKVININIIDLRYVRALQAIFFIKRERIWWMYLVISTSLKCFISPNFSFGIGLNRITSCI